MMDSRLVARSCLMCSRAKAKCVRELGGVACDRCTRLRKECHSKEPVQRRRKVVKQTRTAQLEKLESKIEHLVNALSVQQSQRGLSQLASPTSMSPGSEASRQRNADVLQTMCEKMDRECQEVYSSSKPSPDPNASATVSSTSQDTPQLNGGAAMSPNQSLGSPPLMVCMGEAEILLDRYRRLLAPALPFVVISPAMTAQMLYEQKPVLLHAITTVTYFHDLPKQQRMCRNLMRDISERVLINTEKNIGILQGILVFVAFYHPHIFWGQQVTNLLHLAMAMAIDLSIDRSPQQCHEFKVATGQAGQPGTLKPPPLEEHRALAGIFYLTSMLATSFRKVDTLSNSKYLEHCLDTLQQMREHETDLLLVQMVRLQQLMDDISTTEAPSAPMQMYVKAFEADLAKLKASDPCTDTGNIYLEMQYRIAEVFIWELSVDSGNKAKPQRSQLDDLYRCLEAIKAFITVYFTIPAAAYLTVPFSAFGQFAHAFIVLTKLASLDVDGWDMSSYSLDFIPIIEEAASRFDASTQSSPDGLQVNNESFAKWAYRMRWMKQIYAAKVGHEVGKTVGTINDACDVQERAVAVQTQFRTTAEFDAESVAAVSAQQQPTPPDDVLVGDYLSWLDDSFWQGFGSDLELGFPEIAVT